MLRFKVYDKDSFKMLTSCDIGESELSATSVSIIAAAVPSAPQYLKELSANQNSI